MKFQALRAPTTRQIKGVKTNYFASVSLDLSDPVPHNPPVNLALNGGCALKHSRIHGCRLLLVPLLGLLTCYYSQAQSSPGTTPQNCVVAINPATCQVTVSNCKTTSTGDPLVDVNDTLTWDSPTTPFWIDFNRSGSFSHTPVSASRVPTGQKETVRRDTLCNGGGSCYYKYSLTRQGAPTACADPGVRVVPPQSLLFFYLELGALVLLVGLVSIALWRIWSRKRALSLR